MYARKSTQALKFFYSILLVYTLLCFASIFAIPAAKDQFGNWQGLASSKNGLGQISLISFIIFIIHFARNRKLTKILDFIAIILAFLLLIGSHSSTALLTLIILAILWFLFNVDDLFASIGLKKTVSITIITFSIVFVVLVLYFIPELLQPILGAAGKDLTLTGRLELWSDVWQYTKHYIIRGTGFRSFWVVDSPRMAEFYQEYVWIPIQAHNGYLDIINEVGLVGIGLFLIIIINYFNKLASYDVSQIWKWFAIMTIIINITESTFISPTSVTGVMFIFAYVALFTENEKNKNRNYD